MTRRVGWAGAALAVAALWTAAGSVPAAPTVIVAFTQPAGVHVSARVPSTVTVTAGKVVRRATLSGTPDPRDPERNLRALNPAAVGVPAPPGTPVTLLATLYVCDGAAGVCRVVERRLAWRLRPGPNRVTVPVAAPPRRYLSPRT